MEVVAPLAPPPQAQVRESAFLKKRRYKMKKLSNLAWRRTIFIVAILITSLSLVLAACAPADLSGSAGNKKHAATNDSKHDNPTNTPKPDKATDAPKADNPTNTPKPDKATDAPKADNPTNTPKSDKATKAPKATEAGFQPVTLCHATGSKTNPYVTITVDDQGSLDGHMKHKDDIIPAPSGGCPGGSGPTATPNTHEKITICHATHSAKNPYVVITIDINGLHGHEKHQDDIIPAPPGGCPKGEEPTATPEGPTATPGGPTATHEPPTATPSPTLPPPPVINIKSAPPVSDSCPNWIVFHSFRAGSLNIYRLDGVERGAYAPLIDLSKGPSIDSRPNRSPNKDFVVFQTDRNST